MGMLGIIVSIVINMGTDKIMPSLKELMQNTGPDEKIAVLVYLKEKPDYERIKNLKPKEYVEFLKNFCENSQRDIISYLKGNFSDKISVNVTSSLLGGVMLLIMEHQWYVHIL